MYRHHGAKCEVEIGEVMVFSRLYTFPIFVISQGALDM